MNSSPVRFSIALARTSRADDRA